MTIVADPRGDVLVTANGDARLATAGTGDVLSGILGALLATGMDPLRAAASAAWLHAEAARHGPANGLVAGDIVDALPGRGGVVRLIGRCGRCPPTRADGAVATVSNIERSCRRPLACRCVRRRWTRRTPWPAALAGLSRAGDVILLAGEMGAGKTAFAQGFGRALGVTEPITSPTFTLVHSYDTGGADAAPRRPVPPRPAGRGRRPGARRARRVRRHRARRVGRRRRVDVRRAPRRAPRLVDGDVDSRDITIAPTGRPGPAAGRPCGDATSTTRSHDGCVRPHWTTGPSLCAC